MYIHHRRADGHNDKDLRATRASKRAHTLKPNQATPVSYIVRRTVWTKLLDGSRGGRGCRVHLPLGEGSVLPQVRAETGRTGMLAVPGREAAALQHKHHNSLPPLVPVSDHPSRERWHGGVK